MSTDNIYVLHVDDDPEILDLESIFIEREAPEITLEPIEDPEAALDHLERQQEKVDCIVSDYDMPQLSGLDLLEECRTEFSVLPFIFFTGKGDEEIAEEAMSLGVDDYVQKTSSTDRYELLASKIKHHVEQQRAARDLKNSEEKFRALVEQNIVGIYLIRDGGFTYVNPRLADIFGYEVEEIVGMPPSYLVSEQDQDLVSANIEHRLSGKADSMRYSFTARRKDGEEFEVEVQGQRIELNGEPAVAGVLLEASPRGS